MNTISIKARAKVNLTLDVTGVRENGYHDVRMVMQSVGIYDRIEIRKTQKSGIHLRTNLKFLPVNEGNLAYRAAKLLMDEFKITEGVDIQLFKYIPVAAGMAGGSSDAAGVLFGINRLFGLRLTLQDLMERGATLGADIPFCLMRGTVLAEGIGEILTPLKPVPFCPVLIVKPPISVSTKYVYDNLKLDKNTIHPDTEGMLAAIEESDIGKIASCMGNVLESVTGQAYPVIGQIEDVMMENGAMKAMMSGSGPTVFGLFEEKETAKKALSEMKKIFPDAQAFLTDFFKNRER